MAQVLSKVGKLLPNIKGEGITLKVNSRIETIFSDTDDFIWREIETLFADFRYPNLVPDLMYIINSKAHFERATFIRLVLEGKGRNWKKYGKLLVAEELMYFFQMVLDDIMDKSPMRKGRPTAHEAFGLGKALSYAEILHTFSHKLISEEAVRVELTPHEMAAVWSGFADMIADICFAQCLDLNFEEMSLNEVTEEMYFTFLKNTTPADIANCFSVGGIFSKQVTDEDLTALQRFGLRLGMIMQIRDDLIDFIDDEAIIDKTPFLDIIQNKKRLPLIILYSYASIEDKKRINDIMGKSKLSADDKQLASRLLSNEFVVSYLSDLLKKIKEGCEYDLDNARLAPDQINALQQILTEVADFG